MTSSVSALVQNIECVLYIVQGTDVSECVTGCSSTTTFTSKNTDYSFLFLLLLLLIILLLILIYCYYRLQLYDCFYFKEHIFIVTELLFTIFFFGLYDYFYFKEHSFICHRPYSLSPSKYNIHFFHLANTFIGT